MDVISAAPHPTVVVAPRFGKRDNPLLHASAKSNVGHEEANAGICGFIKAGYLQGAPAGWTLSADFFMSQVVMAINLHYFDLLEQET